MRKTKTRRAGRQPAKPPLTRKANLDPVDLPAIRRQIVDLVGSQALGMVEITIEQVANGHYAAMKYLFELVGLSQVEAATEPNEQNALAKTLLQRLREAEIPRSVNTITKDSQAVIEGVAENPVE